MATHISVLIQASFLFLCLLCALNNGYAQQSHNHIVSVSSLLPSTVCKRTSPTVSNKATLEVISKYGPCSTLNQGKVNNLSYFHILRKDQSRVNFMKYRISKSRNLKQTQAVSIPAMSNQTDGAGEYYIVASLGVPKQDVSLILDTGSGITWTQCKPCIKCLQQRDPIFDPSKAGRSYSNVPCHSKTCSLLPDDYNPSCRKDVGCTFSAGYGDGTSTSGFFSECRIALYSGSGTIVIGNYLFGCSNNNSGELERASGIMGLDRSDVSFVSQLPSKYEPYFSYCLPSSSDLPGYITFGVKDDIKNKFVQFTPIPTTPRQSEYYDIVITGVAVAGKNLSTPASTFTPKSGAIIDSGTVITRLPPKAYSFLRTAFRKQMAKYKLTKPLDFLDTCYDFSSYDTVTIPKISVYFKGGVELDLDVRRSMIVNDVSQVCLAFAANEDDSFPLIFGNVQQRAIEVHYDLGRGRVGFGPGGCS